MINPTESVLEIERALDESKLCILLPHFHYTVAVIFDPGIEGHGPRLPSFPVNFLSTKLMAGVCPSS
jgi:hypothetical protein